MNYEPRVLSFMCHWCGYTAADAAGVARKIHPPYYRTIRVLCSGRVDPLFIFEAFKSDADGVLVCGCKLGECKYLEGNLQALIIEKFTKILIRELGLNENRIKFDWVASTESVKLVNILNKFYEIIKKIGPLGSEVNWNEKDKTLYFNCASKICQDIQIRTALGNVAREIKSLKDFSDQTIMQKLEEKLLNRVKIKLIETEVKEFIKEGIKDIRELSKKIKSDREELEKVYFKIKKSLETYKNK